MANKKKKTCEAGSLKKCRACFEEGDGVFDSIKSLPSKLLDTYKLISGNQTLQTDYLICSNCRMLLEVVEDFRNTCLNSLKRFAEVG